jgi:tricorn protease
MDKKYYFWLHDWYSISLKIIKQPIMKLKQLMFLLSGILTATILYGQPDTRLMRFPATNGEQIVFSYGGDLYLTGMDGGLARKITSHEGYESFPKFSPDGKTIAFTGQYDGNTEVFTIPATGGVPKRITYTATLQRDQISDRMGPNNIVMAWTPDGKNIVFRSRKASFNSFVGQLYKVPAAGGMTEQLPLPRGGFCSFSPDGQKMAYNRVFREFRTWKYYKGGMADEIWIHDFNTRKTIPITNNPAQDIQPMWYKNRIYFLSDRDRTMNLFVYDLKEEKVEKVTHFTDYDIKFPSLGGHRIMFEKGGYIFSLNLEDHTTKRIPIQIGDDKLASRPEIKDVSKQIATFEISPSGKRVLFSARGDIWTVPAEEGITYNLTATSDAHDRNPKWSPDGKYIAFISDQSGEYEIYIQKADGSEPAQQLTKNADTYKYSLLWSPDSKKILWSDKKMRLRYVDIESRQITEVAQSDLWEYSSFNWSPDSKWITYADAMPNDMSRIMLYNLEHKDKTPVTRGWYSSGSPVFSDDGKFLFFTSNRDFNPIYSQTEWNHAYRDMGKIYLVVLSKTTPSPFALKNNEEKSSDKKPKDIKDGNEEKVVVTIDKEGLQDRIINLPVKAGNYYHLESAGNKLFYHCYSDENQSIKKFDFDDLEETDLDFKGGFEITPDNKKMLVGQEGRYAVIPLPGKSIDMKEVVDLSGMKVKIDKQAEWQQIFDESWRQMRDFFYVENMHGVDWTAMKNKYNKLVPYVNNRHDLNYIIGEMIGELSVGHAYVNGGDLPKPKRIPLGLLGAKISKDASGYFIIDKILQGENFRKGYRSPLTEIGVEAAEGDYILAINGQSAKELDNIYKALAGKAGKTVELTLNDEPAEEGARQVLIKPIDDEADLYYYNWVENNRKTVNEATNGQVGYIHIPDMGVGGLNEFVKYFYPQLTKKALIIDDRGNGGGNVSPMIIERLRREVTRANMARNKKIPGHTPTKMMLGPKVLLIDQYSASDGDLFPYSFKKHNLGTVIGVRTWGGVVGIRGSLPFIDGGDLRKPEFASYSSEESKWIIEGYGVEPDIRVMNDPAKEFDGTDEQLNKAIEIIMQQLDEYKPMPEIPEAPDKSK